MKLRNAYLFSLALPFLTLLLAFAPLSESWAAKGTFFESVSSSEMINRLGVGFSRQLMNDIPSLSFKIQKSENFALGGLLGFRSSDATDNSGYGAGIKFYRILFVEPQLRFYTSGLFALITRANGRTTQTGIQFDLTAGTEFHFSGLQSIGFSLEAGASLNKIGGNFNIETVGLSFLLAAAHFYI